MLFYTLLQVKRHKIYFSGYERTLCYFSGQSKADKLVVLSFMIVFAYFFGELRSFLSDADPKTGIMLLQVRHQHFTH